MLVVDRYTCEETFRRLDDYVDRELSPAEMEKVREHLVMCAMCAAEVRFEQSVISQVRQKLQRVAAPADLMARISQSLGQPASGEPE